MKTMNFEISFKKCLSELFQKYHTALPHAVFLWTRKNYSKTIPLPIKPFGSIWISPFWLNPVTISNAEDLLEFNLKQYLARYVIVRHIFPDKLNKKKANISRSIRRAIYKGNCCLEIHLYRFSAKWTVNSLATVQLIYWPSFSCESNKKSTIQQRILKYCSDNLFHFEQERRYTV